MKKAKPRIERVDETVYVITPRQKPFAGCVHTGAIERGTIFCWKEDAEKNIPAMEVALNRKDLRVARVRITELVERPARRTRKAGR